MKVVEHTVLSGLLSREQYMKVKVYIWVMEHNVLPGIHCKTLKVI